MKIEMGESLFYSWLRHVKGCQITQTNWKASSQWTLQNEADVCRLMQLADKHFSAKYGYAIFKNNSLKQLLRQAEIDALGFTMTEGNVKAYAVDVAFHEGGLLYGNGRQDTVIVIIKKFVRTAMCLCGYLGMYEGEIIFASPKIHNSVNTDIKPCIEDLNALLRENGFFYNVRVIANDDFAESILNPILIARGGGSDTSELFLRSYQLIKMFSDISPTVPKTIQKTKSNK